MISPLIIPFLKELIKNNNREWFADKKSVYLEVKSAFEGFTSKLISLVAETDREIEMLTPTECVFRIYRDVRFSKDKTPYKTHFDAFIAKKGGRKSIYAGYYFHIHPGGSLFGGGIYMPIPEVLNALRQEIYNFPDEFKDIINSPGLRKYYGDLVNARLKMPPKGFPKDFPDIELLKYKSYVVTHPLSDKELLSPMLEEKLRTLIKTLYPLNSFLNRAIDYREKLPDF